MSCIVFGEKQCHNRWSNYSLTHSLCKVILLRLVQLGERSSRGQSEIPAQCSLGLNYISAFIE